jgi:hypothetical protein
VFNYAASTANKSLNLARLGLAGTFTAVDLWSGAISSVSGTTWSVSLGAKQAKLFRLGSGSTSATGPTNQALVVGISTTLTTVASGSPPFSYVWRKNGTVLDGQNANTITRSPGSLSDAGIYTVQVTGGSGSVTNTAILTLLNPTNITAEVNYRNLTLDWPVGHTGWRLQVQTNGAGVGLGTNWSDVIGSQWTNKWVVPIGETDVNVFFRLVYP